MSYLTDLFARVAALEREAVPTAAAVPYALYHQEWLPYFTNRLGDTAPEPDSERYSRRVYTVVVRLVVAHLGAGYGGEAETLLYDLIPAVESAFERGRWLQSAAFPQPPDALDPQGVTFARATGLTVFSNAGIPAQQVGVEFTLRAAYHITL
jgi:hypothetical protein